MFRRGVTFEELLKEQNGELRADKARLQKQVDELGLLLRAKEVKWEQERKELIDTIMAIRQVPMVRIQKADGSEETVAPAKPRLSWNQITQRYTANSVRRARAATRQVPIDPTDGSTNQ